AIRKFRDYADRAPDARGLNDRPTEVTAAIARSRIARLDEALARRAERARWYAEELTDLVSTGDVGLPPSPSGRVWYRFAITLHRAFAAPVVDELHRLGVGVEQPVWDIRPVVAQTHALAVAGRAFDRVISLPLYPDLSRAQCHYVCAALGA